jgi:2-dehydro-3-deoxyphosphooctonate aldolase (KDO 8-P synthase)
MRLKIDKFAGLDISGAKLSLIAGPCVLEEEGLVIDIAGKVKEICQRLSIPYIFKASYLKDNRTTHTSYQGPGLDEGLAMLKKVKEQVGVPVLSDVHCEHQVEKASKVLDVLQIPAYLSKQTSLALACGRSGKAINIKKGQFMSPDDISIPLEKVLSAGAREIILTERGVIFGYKDIVLDLRNLLRLKEFGYPVVADITHILRIPGYTSTDPKGGLAGYILPLARAAVACGCDFLFLEVHPQPQKALCDAESMLNLKLLEQLLQECLEIAEIARRGD